MIHSYRNVKPDEPAYEEILMKEEEPGESFHHN